jgi:hypothetical protein
MGAVDFSIIGFGKDVYEAYRTACEEAEEEYGHQEGYSGQINSTTSLLFDRTELRYGTKIYSKYIDKQLKDCPKRTCYAVEIKNKAAVDLKKKYGLTRSHKKVYHFFGVAPE